MIEVKDICKSFGNLQVLKKVSLTVNNGDVVAVIGPSGSGKSTMLRCINRLEVIDGGSISVDGAEINGNDKQIRKIRQNMGMVFQSFNLFPHLTVYDNIALAPRLIHRKKKEELDPLVDELLQKVGLRDKKDSFPAQLSGGQQQRIAIARALAMKPNYMLFDEPTSALDPELIGEVLVVIRQLALEGMTMIIVTHEMNFARDTADRVVMMDGGQIIEEGAPDRLFQDPENERTRAFLHSVIGRQ
ncbi:amino acid ABC transporter ATP-binding protein [Bacilliculturomica massiliensis]|uniref:amino acid ABC transporter ATP-binding protein n=1 Tax=Bacilliculturomica massiliensis TaxID=1917867 RepID=UPI00103236CD|nr:amino acid ABC transporter ATP-binding protein [Bacilliculturomica massiliensis]